MKTVNYFLILATAIVALGSCSGKMSSTKYNEAIVQMHTESWDYLNEKMELIYDYETTPAEDAKALVDSLNAWYDGCLTRLGEMQYPSAAADWHQSTTHLFTYVKDSVLPLFSETLNYEPESEKWYEVWTEIDDRLKVRADELEDQMIEEQGKFAAAIGTKLQ